MIQRIQSIYMLVVSALTVFLMCSDIFTLYSKAETYEVGSLFVNGKDGESLYSVWPVFAKSWAQAPSADCLCRGCVIIPFPL